MLPLHHTLPPHEQDIRTSTCAPQLKELQSSSEFLGKSTQPERKSENKGKFEVSGATPTENIKQSETPSQINRKPHTTGPVPIAHRIMLGFQQRQWKYSKHDKKQEKLFEKKTKHQTQTQLWF